MHQHRNQHWLGSRSVLKLAVHVQGQPGQRWGPNLDRVRQLGIQPPRRELASCCLSWPGQPPKLHEASREEP